MLLLLINQETYHYSVFYTRILRTFSRSLTTTTSYYFSAVSSGRPWKSHTPFSPSEWAREHLLATHSHYEEFQHRSKCSGASNNLLQDIHNNISHNTNLVVVLQVDIGTLIFPHIAQMASKSLTFMHSRAWISVARKN